jgi:hypothetical protein
MKKYIVAATAALTIAIPAVAVPAAQAAGRADAVAKTLQARWGKAVRANAGFRGLRVTQTSVKCAPSGGGYFVCYGTYTVTKNGEYAKYGTTIEVTRNTYRSGNGQLIKQW